jgi:CheY-like chemotaxis protein
VADTLAGAGFSVDLATNGREALAAMRARPTNLLLLDLVMPEMNGFEVLETLADDPALSNIPTVVLTAKNLSREEIELLDRTTRTVLQKNGEWRVRLLQNLQKFVGPVARANGQ